MLVGERRNDNLLVQLDPKLQAQPVELLRQRFSPDGHTEYLIRWALQNVEEAAGNSGTTSQTESKSPNILMWMSAEEVYTNCPTLLGKRKPEGPGIAEEKTSGSPDEGALQEMTEDVRMLVQRATRQMSQSSGPDSSILNTIHVLSAYASIGSLAGVFKETGALDLLMKMLCNPQKQMRKNAGKMLRALASHDAGSRAHVLLSLSQQDGIEHCMDFESRYMLLQLFAETTSSEEHCISFEGLHFPQIPGKQLFSLVKRYLCVSSLLDQMNSERLDRDPTSRLQCQFNFNMGMGSLICELVRVMGWTSEAPSGGWRENGTQFPFFRKVFPPWQRVSHRKHKFKGLSDFSCRSDYVEYMKQVLLPGISVKMLEDYELLKAGDEGVFRQSTKGLPPVEVYWHRLGITHAVHWAMLEIMKHNLLSVSESATTIPPYVNGGTIRRDEWWEILFFIQQLEDEAQKRAIEISGGSIEKDWQTLIQMLVSKEVAQEILEFIVKNCQDHLLSDLQSSHVYSRFYRKAKTPHTAGMGANAAVNASSTSMPQVGAEEGAHAGSSDLQTLNMLLMLEGLELSEMGEKKMTGLISDHDTEIKRSLESCRILAPGVRHVGLEHEWKSADRNLVQEGARGTSGNSALSEKMVGMLVELLTSQMKEKLLVVTCLQLTYLVMSKYDWRVLFATEGGVRAVLECMQEHHSSAAVQHIGLAVLKVLTGVDGGDVQRPSIQNPGDAQVIKEIFSNIGSKASGTSSGLLRAIPAAIVRMISVEGCFSSVYNGLLVIRMLMENDQGLSEQLTSMELTSILKSYSEDYKNVMNEPQLQLLSFLLHCNISGNKAGVLQTTITESPSGLKVQEMDLSSLLSGLKDDRMCREMLPSLERCVCDDVSSLRCDVPQLLTDPSFFLQLLSCLEQLSIEKRLQLSVYRILNKALHLYEEDTLPWHKSVSPSLKILGASGGDRELFQEVVRFLHSLAAVSKDCAMVMCGLRAADILYKAQDKQNFDERTFKLSVLLKACETYSDVHHKMAACVVAGCMQTVLAQIDEHRLRYEKLTVPLLDVFLRSLAGAYTKKEQKEDKCWEKIEVSSNPHRANRLTDGNPKSYWESSRSTGSHYINIYMHRGVVIRQLVMVVASEDSSYMPARVVVIGGENPSNINTELNTVNIASTAGRVLLLENVTRFWPIIQIKIKRCQQGGIDTRVRGLEILGPKPTFWPVFKEQLCRRTFLFYTSRAHSWGQEIRDKKENLLHLFSQLNRALSHEQEFADRFLPDEEAAQALGRTCWEALITPLVQSITTSDPGGVSPFGWLLTRYLENSQGSHRPKSRLSVFNSQVRRLTHLLVHVDTSPPDATVLKPPSKTNGKNRSPSSVPVSASSCGMSSMAGMAQCWQEVVQQQVQRFLEVSWNAVDLVPRFCSMYMALRHAMEEMFGQQAQFFLGLQQGFCQGLLQLSFPTALHVTEQFAWYIHQQIMAIRSDSSDLLFLKQLQQFLECVLFLSDLELANSFENFYRHYLADRLLTLGPCWLENSVVDHIGICFPNRYPQQMLKNLQEAKDLQKEELLYRLQQLDNAIILEDEEEGMATLENDIRNKEDILEVEVCVLTSQFWPFSHCCFMEDPQKYFSHGLARHLFSFTNFFSKCSSLPGSSYIGQSHRLQWTWLGNAEVQYGGLMLRVSTLQMFILLQFNQQEEISEADIINWTGVSDGLLRNALEPLKAKGGVLAIHEDTGCLYLDTSALCDRAGTLLTLSPTRVDGIPDISSVEEKRHLILELVDQVMKEERYIHIDALVAKVISAFQKQNGAPSFPLICCSATDVLSCIMCKLREGSIYRKTNNPLIIGCKEECPPSPPSLIPLLSHNEPVAPIPPQVSEFCSVRKITNNIGTEPEDRPVFRTFRYLPG